MWLKKRSPKAWARLLLVAALTFAGYAQAASRLRKVWDFHIDEGVQTAKRNSSAPLAVIALSFSPDGRHIAAVVGPSMSNEALLVLDSNAPQSGPRRLPITQIVSWWNSDSDLMWSPSGQGIISGREILDFSSGSSCVLPQDIVAPLVFAKPDLVVARRSPVFQGSPGAPPSLSHTKRLREFDLKCRAIADRDLGDDLWNIDDSSPERGLLLLYRQRYHGPDSIEWETTVFNLDTEKEIRHFPLLERARFANGAKMVCGVEGAEWHRSVSCIDADTGGHVAATEGWRTPGVEPAALVGRAILWDYSRKLDWIDGVWRAGPMNRWAIWDFVAGQILASSRPKWQKIQSPGSIDDALRIEHLT